MVERQRQALSPDNPWPGLDPFDEAEREFFYGRAVESDELIRLVRREPLTVLFGRSGLGKTSLLKAGLFHLLRAEDFLPVYLRLDPAEGAPSLRRQIFCALQAACDADQVQAAQPAVDEGLWSFFHRRDAEFWNERNRPVTPVLVLDQFEELFTQAQETKAARGRSAAFLVELGDLVENRTPDSFRQALEAEPSASRRFDFKRATVKLVLSFREDFLAEMEGLKDRMPSLMYNRYRLLAMSGVQAYEVITGAGGKLVDDEVTRRILRLAWKNEPSPPVDPSDLPKIEIDPALLSVVCSELNHKRKLARPPLVRITTKLLEGADREILSGFYERGMEGLDSRVRAFVEDELLSERGYRDSHPLDDALDLPGITSEALEALIRRRLLRVDERQSVRRLELTHDVLSRVVKESRDSRRAREAEMAAKAREQAARVQQHRNSRNGAFVKAGAFAVVVLMILAAWFALEAKRAGKLANKLLRDAESTRLMTQADRLQDVNYDASLLLNLEAVRFAPTLDASAGLMRRFVSHPHLSAFLPGHKDRVLSIAFNPSGRLLASASADKTVILWDADRRKPLATLMGHKDKVWSVAFSPDGKRLASASSDKTVILWDVASRKLLTTLEGHKDVVYGVTFSPDGKQLASASADKTVILWDADRCKPLATLAGHKDKVWSVAFSPDGKQLASASEDEAVILWDVDSRKLLARMEEHRNRVVSVAFSPDGKRLASASVDGAVILWDVNSHKVLTKLAEHGEAIWSVAFSPDGKLLAMADSDNTVILWGLDSRTLLARLAGHKGSVFYVAFSPDGKRLASASSDENVILWDLDSYSARTKLAGHNGKVYDVTFSPDGKRLASASADQSIILWDLDSHHARTTLEGHKDEVWSVAFSPDGRRLASASADQSVILWDLESRRLLATLSGHKGIVFDVVFSPDGKRLASASEDKTAILWDLENRKPLAMLRGHEGPVSSVAFSPDGKRLASAGVDGTIIVWDVESRGQLARFRGHTDWVSEVAFSPDGRWLASASLDHTIILWDVDGGKSLTTLEGHKAGVFGVAFDPDGKRLASAGADHIVMLWDLDSRKPLATLEGHEDRVFSVAFSPDGKRLASASEDGTVGLWDLDLSHLIAEACRTANRNLTCDEWRNYVGAEKPYGKTCPVLSSGCPASEVQ